MSLWLHKRAILRAAAGELAPEQEHGLRDHLRGCGRCHAYYDRAAETMAALGPGGRLVAHGRERARLLAALDGPAAAGIAARAATIRRPLRVLPWLLLPAAAAATLALWPRPAPENDIAWRGVAESAAYEPALHLLVYASRKQPDGRALDPVRLTADLPGSGEGQVSRRDYLQFGYRNLDGEAFLVVLGFDGRGRVHQYLPRPGTAPLRLEPAPGARSVGASLDVAKAHDPGQVQVLALITPAPLDADDLARRLGAAKNREQVLRAVAPDARRVGGTLVVTP